MDYSHMLILVILANSRIPSYVWLKLVLVVRVQLAGMLGFIVAALPSLSPVIFIKLNSTHTEASWTYTLLTIAVHHHFFCANISTWGATHGRVPSPVHQCLLGFYALGLGVSCGRNCINLPMVQAEVHSKQLL